LLFWISEIVISDYLEFYFRYLKLMCCISDITNSFSDIQNIFFWYLKKRINVNSPCHMHLFGYLKLLFWISRIIIRISEIMPKRRFIWDIQKSYFRYQKQQFWISENKHLFRISKIVIMYIRNGYFGYP